MHPACDRICPGNFSAFTLPSEPEVAPTPVEVLLEAVRGASVFVDLARVDGEALARDVGQSGEPKVRV